MSPSDNELQLLETIYSKQDGSGAISQRDLAGASGLSLGMTNALLRRFVERGWVKLMHISSRSLKYILTTEGAEEVLRRSLSYFTRAVRSASLYRDRIDAYVLGLSKAGFRTLVLEGPAELDFLFDYSCARHGLDFIKNPTQTSRQAYLALASTIFVIARPVANADDACEEIADSQVAALGAGNQGIGSAVGSMENQAALVQLADILFDCADYLSEKARGVGAPAAR
jgi:DNA-binding MarR family transcriptional regulator